MAMQGAESSLTSSQSRVMVVDRGRDFDDMRARLTAWLEGRMPDATRLVLSSFSHPVGAGISNETILFEAEWQESGKPVRQSYVLRFHPGTHQMFLDPGFERQIALIRVLNTGGFPAPRILWEEHDPAVLGGAFFVMERVTGRVPVSHPVYNLSGWLFDAPVAMRRTVWEDAMAKMAAIHRSDMALLPFLERPDYGGFGPGDGFSEEYAYWKAAYAWSSGGREVPMLERAYDWLDANMPAAYETGLAWGDARIGNMIFGEDGRVRVVLDWEQASLAGGLHDLAWWLVMDAMFSTGIGVARLDGLGTRDETIALWKELTGRSTDALLWHEVFACARGASLVTRQCWLNARPAPGANPNNNLFTRHLAGAMGWDAPADIGC